jgi:hypothetical protein
VPSKPATPDLAPWKAARGADHETTRTHARQYYPDFLVSRLRLIYSDNGNVAELNTQIVGTYNASGLAAPHSSLNRVFILGQTAAQANTNGFTIPSFDQKGFTLVSSIATNDLLGSPIQLVRWGASGLAVLTVNDGGGSPGVLYLIRDTTFVSSAAKVASASPKPQELVQRRWKTVSKRDILKMVQARKAKLP